MAKEILVADPDKTDQKELQRIFEPAGYRVVFSENGEEAILRVKLFRPDLIIAGVGSGEKSGLELCEAVKGDSEFRHIPVVLLTGIFEEVSEKDRKRVGADGVISKPLREGEILGLVEDLVESGGTGKGEKEAPGQEKGWSSLSDLERPRPGRKQEASLGGLEDEDEEIIDLVEVVEEPEGRMKIDDFIAPAQTKTEPISDIAPLESWDKLFEDAEKTEKEPSGARPTEKSLEFSIEEEKETGPPVDLRTKTRGAPEEELFERIELEEILEKVEKLKPSLEKEWPTDAELQRRVEGAQPGPELETSEKWLELQDFETALKTEVKGTENKPSGEVEEERLAPFMLEESREDQKAEVPKPTGKGADAFDFEAFPGEEKGKPFELEKEFEHFTLEEPKEEAKAEGLKPTGKAVDAFDFETFPREERGKPFELEKEFEHFRLEEPKEEAKAEGLKLTGKAADAFDFETFAREEKGKLISSEEEFQPFSLEESEEEAGAKPGESMFDEIQAFIRDELRKGAPLEEGPGLAGIPESPPGKRVFPSVEQAQPVRMDFEEEPLRELAEEEFPDSLIEELEADEIHGVEEPAKREQEPEVRIFREEVPPGFPSGIGMEIPEMTQRDQASSLIRETPPPVVALGDARSDAQVFDRHLEEVIGKGIQEMMEGFITKVLPQMTQNILSLTAERIEKMVREVVPDLAEKAIQEEIRRLQKEDKD